MKIFKKEPPLIERLSTDFLTYILAKTDEYTPEFIDKNWKDRNDVPLTRAYELIDIGIFRLKIQKELKRRNEDDTEPDD